MTKINAGLLAHKKENALMNKSTSRLIDILTFDNNIELGAMSVVQYMYGDTTGQVIQDPTLDGKHQNTKKTINIEEYYGLSKDRIMNLALCEVTKNTLPPSILDLLIDEANMHRMVGDLIVHSTRHDKYASGGKYQSLDELPRSVIQIYNYFNELAINYINGEVSKWYISRKYRELFSYLAVTQSLYVADVNENDDVRVLFNFSKGIQAIDTLPKYSDHIVDIYMGVVSEPNGQGVDNEAVMNQAMIYYFNLFFNSVFAMKMENDKYRKLVEELIAAVSVEMYETQMMVKGLSTIPGFSESDEIKKYKEKRLILEEDIIDNLYVQYECIGSSLFSRLIGPMLDIYENTLFNHHDDESEDYIMSISEGAPKLLYIFNDIMIDTSVILTESRLSPLSLGKLMESNLFDKYNKYLNFEEFTILDFNYVYNIYADSVSYLSAGMDMLNQGRYNDALDEVARVSNEIDVPVTLLVPNMVTLCHWINMMEELIK